MNYQVLARKWRPHNFTEVVGQQHVVESLKNALQHNRLHHAYLFTGTRGVGKTTLARILAKAINCQQLQDFNPCGQCAVCRDVDQGRFLDLIEVDAASRTKVEDTRDLLDNVQYAPNQGRYKVYLIDEVHMLSGHSFNALLKTLEEPPAHVKFLLATTDPHKIPITVLSRCLQFNLKQLLPQQIAEQMCFILQKEQIAFEMPAIKLLARFANGSMRDGLSLLDQAIVFGNGHVLVDAVSLMLGTVAQQPINDLLQALAQRNPVQVLAVIAQLSQTAPDFGDVLQQLLQALHRIALLQVVPSALDGDIDSELFSDLAKQLSPEDIQLYYQIALLGQKDLDLAPDARSGFEMVLLRMLAFRPVSPAMYTTPTKPNQNLANKIEPAFTANSASSNINTAIAVSQPQWSDIINALNLANPSKQLAQHCSLLELNDKECRLQIASNSVYTERAKDNLEKELQNYCNKNIKLIIQETNNTADTPAILSAKAKEQQLQQAVNEANNDEVVQALKAQFNARIERVEPLTGANE